MRCLLPCGSAVPQGGMRKGFAFPLEFIHSSANRRRIVPPAVERLKPASSGLAPALRGLVGQPFTAGTRSN